MQKLLLSFLIFLGCVLSAVADENIYHTKIADSDIYILSLRDNPVNKDALIPINQAQKDLIANIGDLPLNKHNVMLLKSKNFTALVDTGFANTQERLKEILGSLKVSFSDITHVIVTHGHPDHIGGILDANGVNNFSNAELLVDKKEFDYWQSKGGLAKDSLSAFKKVSFFNHKDNLLKGDLKIEAIAAYGHTPGHNMIALDNQKFVFWADLLNIYGVQAKDSGISLTYDVDPVEAAKSREFFLQTFKKNKTQVIGTHVPFIKPIILQ